MNRKPRILHQRRGPAGYLCGPECREHGGRRRQTRPLLEILITGPKLPLDYWDFGSIVPSPLRSELKEVETEMATRKVIQAKKANRAAATERTNARNAEAKATRAKNRAGAELAGKIGAKAAADNFRKEADRKQVMADRMAHARASRQAKIAAAAKPELTLKEVKAAKKAAAADRLAATAREDKTERTEKSLKEVAETRAVSPGSKELIQPAGNGPVAYYYLAECDKCHTEVRVPVGENGRRIPIGDIKMIDGELVGVPKKAGKGPSYTGKTTKTGRVKRDLTAEQRQAIADRLQGARAAKMGITLEGLRAIKLRPGAAPTAAQLKKYGVKPAAKKSGK